MKDVEIVVFNDKSWVRLTEYQKLKDRYEALEETKEYQNDAICMLQKQIEKMKCCENCKHSYHDRYHTLQCIRNCINFDKWELAE